MKCDSRARGRLGASLPAPSCRMHTEPNSFKPRLSHACASHLLLIDSYIDSTKSKAARLAIYPRSARKHRAWRWAIMRTASNNSSCGVASTSTRSAVSGVWMRQCELDQRRAGRDLARCPRYVVARVGALRKEGGSGGAGGGSRLGRAGGVGKLVPMTEPVSVLDVDRELWEVLDMCSDEELETLYSILYGSSPFSPVVKSLVREEEPAMLELRGRASIMHKVSGRGAHACRRCRLPGMLRLLLLHAAGSGLVPALRRWCTPRGPGDGVPSRAPPAGWLPLQLSF